MPDNQMELLMKIRAEGQQALAEISKMQEAMGKFKSGAKSAGDVASVAFGAVGKTAGILMAPLRMVASVGGLAGTAFVGLSVKALMASAAEEQLTLRMAAVYGSTDKAKTKIEEFNTIARKTGVSTEDLAGAEMILAQYGLAGSENLAKLSGAARVSGGSMRDLALAVGALQMRQLKQFGIDVDTSDGRYVVTYMDNLGKMKKETARSADEMRKSLMNIMAGKFGSKFEAKTFKEMFSGLGEGVEQLFEQFGDGIREKFGKPAVEYLQKKMEEILGGGKLAEWGEKVGAGLMKAFDYGRATAAQMLEIIKYSKTNGPEVIMNFITSAFKAGAEILAVGFMTYLQAMSGILVGLAKMMSGAFLEAIADVPGMGGVRKRLGQDSWATLSSEEQAAHMEKYGVKSIDQRKPANWDQMSMNAKASFLSEAGASWEKDLFSGESSKALMQASRAKIFNSGISDITTGLPAVTSQFGTRASDIIGRYSQQFRDSTGFNAPSIAERAAGYAEERDLASRPVYVTAARTVRKYKRAAFGDKGVEGIYQDEEERKSTMAPQGKYQMGQDLGGGFKVQSIVIQDDLNVRANETRQLQNEVLQAANRPAMAAAST